MKKGILLNEVFDRLKTAVDVVESKIEGGCAKSSDFGVVTSCPTNIGTGMRASVHLALPNLTSDGTEKKAKEICRPLGLSVRGLGGEHTAIGKDGTVDISPSARFCISEAEIVTALYKGIKLLKEKEDQCNNTSNNDLIPPFNVHEIQTKHISCILNKLKEIKTTHPNNIMASVFDEE